MEILKEISEDSGVRAVISVPSSLRVGWVWAYFSPRVGL